MSEQSSPRGEAVFAVRLRPFRTRFTPEAAIPVWLDEEVSLLMRESALVAYEFGPFLDYAIIDITPCRGA